MRVNFRNTKNYILAGLTALSVSCSKDLSNNRILLAATPTAKLYEVSSNYAISLLKNNFDTIPIDTFQVKNIHLDTMGDKDLSKGLSKKDTFEFRLWYKMQTTRKGKNALNYKRFVKFNSVNGYSNIDTIETVTPNYKEIWVANYKGKNKGKVTTERSYELPGRKAPLKAEKSKFIEI